MDQTNAFREKCETDNLRCHRSFPQKTNRFVSELRSQTSYTADFAQEHDDLNERSVDS